MDTPSDWDSHNVRTLLGDLLEVVDTLPCDSEPGKMIMMQKVGRYVASIFMDSPCYVYLKDFNFVFTKFVNPALELPEFQLMKSLADHPTNSLDRWTVDDKQIDVVDRAVFKKPVLFSSYNNNVCKLLLAQANKMFRRVIPIML